MAFLTIEQAAKEFDSSVHTLRTIARDGRLPGARKIGGRWFVHRATLERFFETSAPNPSRNGGPVPAAINLNLAERGLLESIARAVMLFGPMPDDVQLIAKRIGADASDIERAWPAVRQFLRVDESGRLVAGAA
jgi:excisionase family DNA binding protein